MSHRHRRQLLVIVVDLLGTASVPDPGTHPTASAPAPQAERRQLPVLFCHLVGATALAARLDPEDLREVVVGFQHGCAEVIARHGGHLAQFLGDGVLAHFGHPQAHEDDPERAVRAGLELAAAAGRPMLPDGRVLQARIGIATGLAVVGDAAGGLECGAVGETPNRAARLQAVAEPGAVVIDATSRRRLGGLFACRDLGLVAVKGFAAPVRAWRVLRPNPVRSRSEALHATAALAPLVGRAEELAQLQGCWARAKVGEGGVVLLAGEPGIGKSRLAAALVERLADEPYVYLPFFCSPRHQDSPLHPVIGQLERAARFARDDAPAARLAKLEALLRAPRHGDAAGLIAACWGYPLATLAPRRGSARSSARKSSSRRCWRS